MSGKKIANVVTAYAGLQVQTSSLGVQIAVGWGTFRCPSNLIDYLDFTAIPQKAAAATSGGGKGGGSNNTVTGYTYTGTIVMGVCEGPIDQGLRTFVDGNTYASPALANVALAGGSIGQAPWSYLTSKHPTHALGYSGLCYAFQANYPLNSGASTPQFSFEIQRAAAFGAVATGDVNAALVVQDFFQNPKYGVKSWGANLLDANSFFGAPNAFSRYCYAANLMISPAITAARSGKDFIDEVMLATNSTCLWSEGVLKIIPYGDTFLGPNFGITYTPNNTPVYSLDDDDFIADVGVEPIKVDLNDQALAYNTVQLEYLDRANQYNIALATQPDAADVAQFGQRLQNPTTVHVICDANVANISANLYLQRTLYVRANQKFSLDWKFALLEPGDLLELTDPDIGYNAYAIRITEIDESEDDSYNLIGEDFQQGVAHSPLYEMQTGNGTIVNRSVDPGGVEANLLTFSGDISQSVWTKVGCTVASNVANDQYGLATADAMVTSASGLNIASLAAGQGTEGVGSATQSIQTVGAAAGGAIVVWVSTAGGETINSVTDAVGNAYTPGTQLTAPGGKKLREFRIDNPTAIPVNGTITATLAAPATGLVLINAIQIAGDSGFDVEGAGTTGTGTAPSVATGGLAQANEIVVSGLLAVGGAADTFTEAGTFTSEAAATAVGGDALRVAVHATAGTGSVTYNPTLGTSRAYAANVLAVKVSTQLEHYVGQVINAFPGENYTFSVCVQKNAHFRGVLFLNDENGNGAAVSFDANLGTLVATSVSGLTAVVAASVNPTLVNGIWQVVLTATGYTGNFLGAYLFAVDDSGDIAWVGDGLRALNLSQFQVRQGLAPGVYCETQAIADGPIIFNPPSSLTEGGSEVWAVAAGGPFWGGAYVWVSLDGGASFGQLTDANGPVVVDSCRFGYLTADFPAGGDPDTTHTLSVDLSRSGSLPLTSADASAADNGGSLCLLSPLGGTGTQELIDFSTATLTNPSRYNLSSYIRRNRDGTANVDHPVTTPLVRCDGSPVSIPFLPKTAGAPLLVKFQSFNIYGGAPKDLSACLAYGFIPGTAGSIDFVTRTGANVLSTVNQHFSQSTDPALMFTVYDAATWYNTATGIFYQRINGQWVALNPATTGGGGGGGSPVPPGQLLFASGGNVNQINWNYPVAANGPTVVRVRLWGGGGGGEVGGGYDAGIGGSGAGFSESTLVVTPGSTNLSGVLGAAGAAALARLSRSVIYTPATAGGASTCANTGQTANGGGVAGAAGGSATGGNVTNGAGTAGNTSVGGGNVSGGQPNTPANTAGAPACGGGPGSVLNGFTYTGFPGGGGYVQVFTA